MNHILFHFLFLIVFIFWRKRPLVPYFCLCPGVPQKAESACALSLLFWRKHPPVPDLCYSGASIRLCLIFAILAQASACA
jgi:hypothetical protein